MMEELINQAIQGYCMIGDAITDGLILLCQSFGFTLPDWGARLSMLGSTALLVWRFQKMIPKLILFAVCIIAASIVLGWI